MFLKDKKIKKTKMESYVLYLTNGKQRVVTVPYSWTVVFKPISNKSEKLKLEFYEFSTNPSAVFTDVESFRPQDIGVKEDYEE